MAGLAATVIAVVLLLGGGCAWATVGHSFAGQFGGPGAGDGQFSGSPGAGVMAPTGEVFTVDAGSAGPRVQRFSAGGVFQSSFAIDAGYSLVGGIAVDAAGAGAVYVSAYLDSALVGVVGKYSAAGVFAYELDPSGSGTAINNRAASGAAPLAVDPVDGTVYAAAAHDDGRQVVDRFDGTTGAFSSFFDGSSSPEATPFCGSPTSLAVDSLQRVYVLDPCKGPAGGRVDRFSAAGAWEATVDVPARSDGTPETPLAVAVDPVSDEAYVAHTGPAGLQVTQFTAGGAAVVYTFDAPDVGGVAGMAASGAGTVYLSDGSFVKRFTRFDGPTVLTGGVSSPGPRSVVVEGTINPEGVSSSYYFEYGTGPSYGKRTPATGGTDAGSGSTPVPAAAALDGLEPNKTYHYRLVGFNSSGSIAGADGSFTTQTAPPDIGPVRVSAITPRSARLHGAVNSNNSFAFWHFEYGTTTAYGTSAPAFDGFLAPAGTDQAVSSDIAGLEPATAYHFRLVASDCFGCPPVTGPDQAFVTAPAAGGGASGVTAGRAALTGTIDPHGIATSYHFDYGVTTGYGASTPEADGGSGDGERNVSQEISGLLADTTYHVRVVATSANGVVRYGGDGAFRTAPAPAAEVIAPTEISTDAATLAGEVSTYGVTGSYHFDVWSLNGGFTRSTPERPAAGNASAERVSAALTGLPAGETFVVRLTVSSNDASGVSDLLTFATPEVPKEFPPPPPNGAYGCGSPRLDAYNKRPEPGEMITITGQDLGVGGNFTLADRSLEPADWSPTGFKVLVPRDAAGTLALTVNCSRRSNTIAITVFQEPDNHFAITGRSVTGTTATLKVKVPGPGKLESSGAGTAAVNVTAKKAGTASIKVRLTSAGAKALARAASHARKVKVLVRFTPAGGHTASKTLTITFKHKSAHAQRTAAGAGGGRS